MNNPWLRRALVAVVAFVLFLNIGGIVTVRVQAGGERGPGLEESFAPVPYLVDYQEVTIPADDGVELHAWFMPGSPAGLAGRSASVLVLPGSSMAGHAEAALEYGPALTRAGYNVLSFSYRGRGQSSGATRNGILLGLDQLIDDAETALAYLRSRPEVGRQPVAALGCSLGTGVALGLAARTGDVRALILDSPWSDFVSSQESQADLGSRGWQDHVPFFWHLLRFWTAVAFQADLDRTEPVNLMRQVGEAPVFIVHRAEDQVLHSREAEKLYRAAAGPKQIWIVPGRGHCDASLAAEPEFAAQTEAFLGQHLLGLPGAPFALAGSETRDREVALSLVNRSGERLPLAISLHRPERGEPHQEFHVWLEPGTAPQGILLPISSPPEFMNLRRHFRVEERGPSWDEELSADAQAWRSLGEAEGHMARGDRGQAQHAYQLAQRAAPENPRILFEAGAFFLSQGFLDEASDNFFRALAAPAPSKPGPDLREWGAMSLVYTGRVFDLNGNRREAVASYRKALEFRIPRSSYWAQNGLDEPWRG